MSLYQSFLRCWRRHSTPNVAFSRLDAAWRSATSESTGYVRVRPLMYSRREEVHPGQCIEAVVKQSLVPSGARWGHPRHGVSSWVHLASRFFANQGGIRFSEPRTRRDSYLCSRASNSVVLPRIAVPLTLT